MRKKQNAGNKNRTKMFSLIERERDRDRRHGERKKGRRSGRESETVLGHGSDCLRIGSLRK